MGSRVTKEYWCDTCGQSFKDEWTWYHKHIKYAGGSALWHLSKRIENAESEDEAFYEICKKFGFSKGTATCNVGHAFYDEEVIKCIIDGMRNGMIHNEDWECDGDPETLSNDKVADFIEKSIPNLKIAYNDFIKRAINDTREEYERKIVYLEDMKVE
jgi:hypothetical protein